MQSEAVEQLCSGAPASGLLLEPTFGVGAAHVVLDVVQGLEGIDRDRGARVVRFERLHEVSARVHVASDLDEVGAPERFVEDARGICISAIPPVMVPSAKNPGGTPIEVFDGYRNAQKKNRAQFFLDVASGPFYGFNRPGAKVSEGIVRNWWRQGMMGGTKATYDCIKVFSETDFTEDLPKIAIPLLVMHSEDDQVVPFADAGPPSAKLAPKATLKVYKGLPHGMPSTHPDVVNADLLAFLRG